MFNSSAGIVAMMHILRMSQDRRPEPPPPWWVIVVILVVWAAVMLWLFKELRW